MWDGEIKPWSRTRRADCCDRCAVTWWNLNCTSSTEIAENWDRNQKRVKKFAKYTATNNISMTTCRRKKRIVSSNFSFASLEFIAVVLVISGLSLCRRLQSVVGMGNGDSDDTLAIWRKARQSLGLERQEFLLDERQRECTTCKSHVKEMEIWRSCEWEYPATDFLQAGTNSGSSKP